jgi:hypothetical protein
MSKPKMLTCIIVCPGSLTFMVTNYILASLGMNIRSKMDIYDALITYFLNHEHFNYYLAYFNSDLSWHRAMYERIIDYINDKSKFIFEELVLFTVKTENCYEQVNIGYDVEKLHDPKEFLEFTALNMKPLIANCYCYNNQFNLDKISNIYEMKELLLKRVLFRVTNSNEVIAYIVAEVYSTGLNLYNLIDCCRIYFVNTNNIDLNQLLKSALPTLNKFYSKYSKKYYYIFISKNYDLNFNNLVINNFQKSLDAGRVIGSREGMAEYRDYFHTLSR